MKLHGYFRSSASYRVRIALNLKGLSAEHLSYHLRKGEQRAHQQHDSRIQCSSRISSRIPLPIPRPRAVGFVPCWPLQAPHRDLSSRDSNEALFQYEHAKVRSQRQTNTALRLSSQWCGAGRNAQRRRLCQRKSLVPARLTLARRRRDFARGGRNPRP